MRTARHATRGLSLRSALGAAIALAVAGAIALAMSPAEAKASTVSAQLTLSGVASAKSPTGGAVVGVHPGDSVALSAAAIPTAGAPAGLGSALTGLVSGVAGLQVKILSSHVPGVRAGAILNNVPGCTGARQFNTGALGKGTYSFTYQVQTIPLAGLLGLTCNSPTKVTPTQSQLDTLTRHNVSVTDHAVYSGRIVAATNPPAGSIGVQLPKQSISAKVGPIHTSVNLPGATVGVPNPVDKVTSIVNKVTGSKPGSGGGGQTGGNGGTGSTGGSVNYTPPKLTVPEQVMPHADHVGGSGSTGFAAPGGGGGGGVAGIGNASETSPAQTAPSTADASPAAKKKNLDLSQRTQLGGQQLPALLAIAAILALSIVTSIYARMTLLRRH